MLCYLLYQVDKVLSHSARIKRLRSKALIEENGYSLVKINNAAYKPFKLALRELARCALISLNLFDLE